MKRTTLMTVLCLLGACAGTAEQPDLPYPVAVVTGEIEERFLAALPGVRAREFSSDMRTRAIAARVDIPMDWKGTTGGEPGKALEIYVLAGELRFSDFALGPGGYAYVPPGSLGFALASDIGAQVLYFLDEIDEKAVIRAPIIMDGSLLPWEEVHPGVFERELRRDPGTGARSWLLRVEPGASLPWSRSSVNREGYFIEGDYTHGECYEGVSSTWDYLPGGYFRRPAGVVNGGPPSVATASSVWYLRELAGGTVEIVPTCDSTTPTP